MRPYSCWSVGPRLVVLQAVLYSTNDGHCGKNPATVRLMKPVTIIFTSIGLLALGLHANFVCSAERVSQVDR